MADDQPRLRFAPSPTGYLHLGGARTALFNWLYARRYGGIFILRIEDTDKERSKTEYEDQILDGLRWLGLDWDEGVGKEGSDMRYRQSERTASYRVHLERLLSEKKAYWCYCTKEDLEAEKQLALTEGRAAKYSGRCRHLTEPPAGREPQVIRIHVPGAVLEFEDMVRGKVSTDLGLLGDFVIAKGLDEPLYNFAVVVDDEEMKISHVIRGEDHISNTPKQIFLQRALGFSSPRYGHLPLVLNADRSKLSKRYADVNVVSYREQGYLPQALGNYLALLGWHPQDEREVLSIEEISSEFDMSRVQKAGGIWNDEKLRWLNREHIKRLSTEELLELIRPHLKGKAKDAESGFLLKVVEAVRERMHVLSEFEDFASVFFDLPDYAPELLVWKKGTREEALEVLPLVKDIITGSPVLEAEAVLAALTPLAEKKGKGNVLWPLRVALSGQATSPDPFTLVSVLGKDESLRRIDLALNKL